MCLLIHCHLFTDHTLTEDGVCALAEAVDSNPSLSRLLFVAGNRSCIIDIGTHTQHSAHLHTRQSSYGR